MRYELIIDGDTAALIDDPVSQITRVLKREIETIKRHGYMVDGERLIRDHNGNIIGQVEITTL